MLKKLFCKHNTIKCITNLYGDSINDYNCRSVWECTNCGKRFYSNELDPDCRLINFCLFKEASLTSMLNKEMEELSNHESCR